ncbi:hypothetical protein B0H10DRAFT_2208398 [Mycena sp. CBHHK59/15]|nr:hypothetical protein B0H10DRAFT_2208398 [Mycena sp. CBHHK59/15]
MYSSAHPAPDYVSQSDSDDGNALLFESEEDISASLTFQSLNTDGTPKRPMNAFMIFARYRRPQLSAENQSLRTGDISKILSQEWKAMLPIDKQFYLDQAKKLREAFNAKHPNYQYTRSSNGSRRKTKSRTSVETGITPVDLIGSAFSLHAPAHLHPQPFTCEGSSHIITGSSNYHGRSRTSSHRLSPSNMTPWRNTSTFSESRANDTVLSASTRNSYYPDMHTPLNPNRNGSSGPSWTHDNRDSRAKSYSNASISSHAPWSPESSRGKYSAPSNTPTRTYVPSPGPFLSMPRSAPPIPRISHSTPPRGSTSRYARTPGPSSLSHPHPQYSGYWRTNDREF